MGPDRLKAFTDGVLAIIITIMVLELRVPHDGALSSLRPLEAALVASAPLEATLVRQLRACADACRRCVAQYPCGDQLPSAAAGARA